MVPEDTMAWVLCPMIALAYFLGKISESPEGKTQAESENVWIKKTELETSGGTKGSIVCKVDYHWAIGLQELYGKYNWNSHKERREG